MDPFLLYAVALKNTSRMVREDVKTVQTPEVPIDGPASKREEHALQAPKRRRQALHAPETVRPRAKILVRVHEHDGRAEDPVIVNRQNRFLPRMFCRGHKAQSEELAIMEMDNFSGISFKDLEKSPIGKWIVLDRVPFCRFNVLPQSGRCVILNKREEPDVQAGMVVPVGPGGNERDTPSVLTREQGAPEARLFGSANVTVSPR